MLRKSKDSLEWLEFEQLAEIPELVHGIFLRHGGVSASPYTSLNIGGGSGDDFIAIAENRMLISAALGIREFVSAKQVHADHIEVVSTPNIDGECDGLITEKKGLGLLIKHADCQAAIFYDPIKKVVANIHCGWRGSVKNIYRKTVETFMERFGSRPENILVSISPSLGPNKAEFINHKEELPNDFLPFQVKPNHFDFWAIAKNQLLEAKILENHIEIAKICTFENSEDFFSYRREKETGRHGTIIAIK